jgi:DNA-binding PadR family transcriptional regulator
MNINKRRKDMNYLSRIEEILLLAIWKLKDSAYGISIRDQVEKDTGVDWLSGAIYAPLSRLKKNGYVETFQAKGSTEKGGRPRIYYRLSSLGIKKLVSIQEVNKSVWLGVPDLKNKIKL